MFGVFWVVTGNLENVSVSENGLELTSAHH